MELQDIEIRQQEEEERYKKNKKYKKIRKIGIILSVIITIIFISLTLTNKKDDSEIFNLESTSKLLENGDLEIREELEYLSYEKDLRLKRIIPFKKDEIKDIDVRVVLKQKEKTENKENKNEQNLRAIKAEKTTKEEYDSLNEEEKEEKLYYYLAELKVDKNLANSNIKDSISYLKKENTEKIEKQEENKDQNEEEKDDKSEKRYIIYVPLNKKIKETQKIVLNYTKTNAAISYKDCSELAVKIMDEKDPGFLNKAEVEVEFPEGGIKKENGISEFFGMYDGKSEIASNKLKLETVRDLNYHEGLKLNALFKEPKLSKDAKKEEKEYFENAQKIYNEEKEKQNKEIKKYLEDEKKIKTINRGIIYASSILFSVLFVKIFIDIINELSTRKDIESVIKSFKYYDNPPEEFKFNFSKIEPLMERGRSDTFKSIFLKLIYKGLVIPKKQKKFFSVSSYNNILNKTISKAYNVTNRNKKNISEDTEIEYLFYLDKEDFKRQDGLGYILNEDRYVFGVLEEISIDDIFTLSELMRYLRENFKTKIDKDLEKIIYIEKEKLTESGYFDKDSNKKDLKVLKQNTFNILILFVFLILSIIFNKGYTFPIYISVFSFIIAVLNTYRYKIHLKGINAKGLQAESQIKGFRNFLRDSSFLDLKSDSKKDINKVRQFLMYSVYFGIDEKFLAKTTQYNDVNFRRIYKELEEEESKIENIDDEEEKLKFKYKDVSYLIRKIDESIIISRTYYGTGLNNINLFENKPKRDLRLKK